MRLWSKAIYKVLLRVKSQKQKIVNHLFYFSKRIIFKINSEEYYFLLLCLIERTLKLFGYFYPGHTYILFILSFTKTQIGISDYTQDSLEREARASETSLHRAREGSPPYPTCCYVLLCALYDACSQSVSDAM